MMGLDRINVDALRRALAGFSAARPYSHCVVDDFFDLALARRLAAEFPSYDSNAWFVYDNPLENKRALNDWNAYPPVTYSTLSCLNSEDFVSGLIGAELGIDLRPDPGLHGGGWHIHGRGGNLNPHVDYHIHPKLGLVRRLNLIVYLSSELDPPMHGGHFGLWEHDSVDEQPGQLAKEVAPAFNRAVLFDTTQNSWHGMSRPLSVPDGIYRKSLAVYYLTVRDANDQVSRKRALFAPRDHQRGDPRVEEIIRKRVDLEQSKKVYRS